MNLLHTPLRTKLRLVILATCIVALLVACVVLFAVQFYFFRKDNERDLTAWASTYALTTSPATEFEDAAKASQLLSGLSTKAHIQGAQIRLESGEILATYKALGHYLEKTPLPEKLTYWRDGTDAICAVPILGKEKNRVGAFYLVSDYATPAARLVNLYLAIFCAVSALAACVGLLVSNWLAQVITRPLQYLATTVGQIAGSNNYSLRAEKTAEDEVGAFTDSFNKMIGRIEDRDAALRHEIAERERAEKELQTMHLQLLDASRQAGMAEVATGVLHNVGNVLNSVNVSASLVAEKLNIHRLNNLVRTADLLREKNGSVADFLTHDPRGKLIPGYLAELSKHLVSERQDALVELELLTKNIEHIKEIVSMQQNYASVAGLVEQMPTDALLEDALRMTTGSLQRHHIDVVRDFTPCPPILAERHKVLQILVNLMRNAKHSMDETSQSNKTLTLRIHESAPGFVAITIRDNGVGIPAENLTKIFAHGFTTRKDGHGFGLHSAALAAQQMGGRLDASSDGTGKGATFTLELPLAKKEVAA